MYQETFQASDPSSTTLPQDELARLARSLFSSAAALAARLDHTLLKPEATEDQVIALCREAAEHRFACAMVNPAWIPIAVDALQGSEIRVGTVLGFPLGASLPQTKASEARDAARAGALDLDMVLNVGALRSGFHKAVLAEIRGVAVVAHEEGAILKVILETCLLDEEQKGIAATLCVEGGADFVKTSTGFSSGGATEADVRLLRVAVGAKLGVKASGGIRTLSDMVRMTMAGANRIGASASVAIVEAYRSLLTV